VDPVDPPRVVQVLSAVREQESVVEVVTDIANSDAVDSKSVFRHLIVVFVVEVVTDIANSDAVDSKSVFRHLIVVLVVGADVANEVALDSNLLQHVHEQMAADVEHSLARCMPELSSFDRCRMTRIDCLLHQHLSKVELGHAVLDCQDVLVVSSVRDVVDVGGAPMPQS